MNDDKIRPIDLLLVASAFLLGCSLFWYLGWRDANIDPEALRNPEPGQTSVMVVGPPGG